MRLAITADLHIDAYGSRVDPETGLSARLLDCLRTTTWVAAEARARGCEALIVAGDLTENRHPSPWLVARIMEALSYGPDRVIVTRGNHDGARAGRSIVDIIDGHRDDWVGIDRPHFTVVGDTAICGLGYMDRHQLRASTLTDVPDADVYRALADHYLTIARGLYAEAMATPGVRRAILVGHQTVGGALMSDTQRAFLGDLGLVLDGAALSAIGYSLVAMGHLHRGQTVVEGECPVVYPGSVERVDFGEEAQEKSFLVVDLPDAGPVAIERVVTPARRFVTLDGVWDGQDVAEAIVRVRDVPPEVDAGSLRRALEAAGAFEVHGIERRRIEAPAASGGLSEGLTPQQALSAWFEGDDDAEALVERGREVITAVAA